jgi:hypothetical protein
VVDPNVACGFRDRGAIGGAARLAAVIQELRPLAWNRPGAPYLKSEDKPDCRIDRVAIEVAVSQSIIDLREHESGVSLKLRRKPPIDGE